MGCDIHLFVEYRSRGGERWRDFGGEINPGRNYGLFGYLAGVRGYGPVVAEPRGFPADAAYAARWEYTKYVTETQEDADQWRLDGEAAYPRERAESWVRSGASVWLEGPHDRPHHGLIGHVSDPGAHTPSWLTLTEFGEALENLEAQGYGAGPEYRALRAAMESLEANGYETRVVFWFDN